MSVLDDGIWFVLPHTRQSAPDSLMPRAGLEAKLLARIVLESKFLPTRRFRTGPKLMHNLADRHRSQPYEAL
jgi:hypothetical protein